MKLKIVWIAFSTYIQRQIGQIKQDISVHISKIYFVIQQIVLNCIWKHARARFKLILNNIDKIVIEIQSC